MLERHIDELGRIGDDAGSGLFRPVYGRAWSNATSTVENWFRMAGLETRRDPMGNVIGGAAGSVPGVILTGSHIDTVRGAGRYDGALGIHAGLAAVSGLVNAYGRPRRTIEVIALCEEEGSRFPCQFWGTRGILGLIDPAEPDLLVDAAGVSIGDAMRSVGLDPGSIPAAARSDLLAFIELHIEQGPKLDLAGSDIGVPDSITGLRQMEITVTGRQDHAGTTPMDNRCDPLVASAKMAIAINALARRLGSPAVATVGHVEASPGAVNVVPREVRFTVDLRHPDPEAQGRLIKSCLDSVVRIGRRAGVRVEVRQLLDQAPVPLDSALRAVIRSAASREGADVLEFASGAGHDSMIFARHVPTAMVFVPSRDGRSHCPEEWTPLEQVLVGVQVLASTLRHLAYES